jgi:hypothetical protein
VKMLPPQVVIEPAPARRRGRPTLAKDGTPPAYVHLTLSPDDFDAAEQIAKSDPSAASIQDVIRRALKRLIADERGGMLRNKKT